MRRSGCGLYPRRLSRPIAIVLLRGVFQVILSTPGVRLPEFSVTRRMARSLPLRERVSRCSKAFTLCHLPACIAFTIRAWSRLTFASATSQSVSSHGSVVVSRCSRETAPTVPCGPIDICNCLLRPFAKFSRNETPSGVCPLSRWVSRSHQGECARWAPYPSYYRTAFAYPSSSYPHTPSLALRLSYPV